MEKGNLTVKGGGEESEAAEDPAEQLDPRIQVELEKLNSLTDVINKLELDLEVNPKREPEESLNNIIIALFNRLSNPTVPKVSPKCVASGIAFGKLTLVVGL